VFPKTRRTPEKVAVDKVNLTVPKGECFGFLGINGAGKTTTLSMLTHDVSVTSGDAYIAGYSVTRDFKNTQSIVGYCPQFDPLMGKMTGREHLRLFGRLKGIPAAKIDRAATQLLQRTGMAKHGDVLTENYSGGTKRKLSLAIALIGSPEVVFLDEPSSGMDPVARHQMWDVIKTAAQNKSVTLTTHSMEECEALCTRVGIMVSGQFHCLGSIQHLKSKFGKGYLMEIKAEAARMNEIKSFVAREFQESVLTEEHSELLKYSLPKTPELTLGSIFETIEENRVELNILDYGVSQTTLEEVFINVARKQEEEEAARQVD
jgi:ABC-type multidrug transport system ATPase subunit